MSDRQEPAGSQPGSRIAGGNVPGGPDDEAKAGTKRPAKRPAKDTSSDDAVKDAEDAGRVTKPRRVVRKTPRKE